MGDHRMDRTTRGSNPVGKDRSCLTHLVSCWDRVTLVAVGQVWVCLPEDQRSLWHHLRLPGISQSTCSPAGTGAPCWEHLAEAQAQGGVGMGPHPRGPGTAGALQGPVLSNRVINDLDGAMGYILSEFMDDTWVAGMWICRGQEGCAEGSGQAGLMGQGQ